MAFDIAYLVNIGSNGYNSIYVYAGFNENNGGDVGGTSGVYKGHLNGGQGYFYDARNQLRVGDIIFAGVSKAIITTGNATAGVSRLVVTHVSAGSTAGVTVAATGGK